MSLQEKTNCDVRGFIFDTASHGNPGNVDPTKSGYIYHITECGSFSSGAFSMEISGLSPGTKYYYRACAHNLKGWSYGDEVEFQTKDKNSWKKIISQLEFEGLEVGFPSGIKFKIKSKKQKTDN